MKTLFYSLLVLFGGCVLVSCNDDDSVGGGGSSNGSAMRLDSMYSYSYNDLTKQLDGRQVFTYNERGLRDTVYSGSYTQSVGGRIYSENYHVYSYDDKDSLISDMAVCKISDMWKDESEDYEDIFKWKTDYIRNAKGQITAEISYQMNNSTGEWVPYLEKKEYTYNAAGKLVKILHYSYEDGSYKEDQRFEYTYDSKGRLQTKLIDHYQMYSEERFEYTYNSKNQLEQYVLSFGNQKQRVLYTYNKNGDKTSCLYSELTTSDSWPDHFKSVYTYDGSNQLTSQTDYYYRDGRWAEDSMSQFSHNQYGVIYQMENFTYSVDHWENTYTYEFFYSEKK